MVLMSLLSGQVSNTASDGRNHARVRPRRDHWVLLGTLCCEGCHSLYHLVLVVLWDAEDALLLLRLWLSLVRAHLGG